MWGIKVVWKAFRQTIIFLFVIIVFLLILLLPKEMEVTHISGLKYKADFPFELTIYMENITEFISYFREEKGFGTTPGGVPLAEEMFRFLKRSLKIIIPAFLLSMTIGILIGMSLFYFRKTRLARLLSFLSWTFTSIPDFFLFISVQYLIIIAMRYGLPSFHMYSSDDWYSFIFPCICLSIFPLFHMVKVTIVSMENEVGEEYVRTAISKGMTDRRVMEHMFWNGWSTIVNQSQMVMLYIISSLPIIEKLSNYKGAGYQLLVSIFSYDHVRSLLLFLPFLILMFFVVIVAQFAREWFLPKDVDKA